MIYPDNFEEITGFGRLREMLAGYCRFESSAMHAGNMQLLTSVSEIKRLYDQADEWGFLLQIAPAATDLSGTTDISSHLAKLHIENHFLQESDFFEIRNVLQKFQKLHQSVFKKDINLPELQAVCGHPESLDSVLAIIQSVIDAKGILLPYASVEYGKLSQEIERLEKDTRQVVRGIFRSWRDAGYTAETDITVREERLVIPVQAEHKRHVKGFVKDVSATGKVIYMEPMESLEMNNRLVELLAELRRERERILRLATAKLLPYKPNLEAVMQSLGHFDWIAARVRLHKQLGANRVQLQAKPGMDIKNAVNPLLWLKNKSEKKETVPMWLKLDHADRIFIISGPNAGGKSITLKTAMLLQYMVQCGLFATCEPESEFGIFKHLAVDCGDGQSIDEGLSTFSAHLQHLKKMTTIAGPNSLFGVDELGDGTDPRFGGPIAQAVLESFLKAGSFAIVTTHYSRLKEWAGHTPNVVNASMAYDTRGLRPLYKLVSGRPGSSFALELLRKTGFENELISRVETLSGEESQKTEDLLLDLEEKQRELNEILGENKHKQQQLDLLLEEYNKLKEKIESKRKDILDAAKHKAAGLLNEANKQIELTIRTIREHGANKEKTVVARQKLKAFETKNITENKVENAAPNSQKSIVSDKTTPPQQKPKIKVDYVPGMVVRNLSNSSKGEILEVKKSKILVAFGLLKMWVTSNEIEPITETVNKQNRKAVSGFNWVERQSVFSPVLDVRGLKAEDALAKVRNWMDEAYALGQPSLKIIHGRGDGILRKILREYFKTLNFLRSYRSEHEQQGGDGCTLVELM